MTVAEFLELQRLFKSLTQSAFAELIGVSTQAQYSRLISKASHNGQRISVRAFNDKINKLSYDLFATSMNTEYHIGQSGSHTVKDVFDDIQRGMMISQKEMAAVVGVTPTVYNNSIRGGEASGMTMAVYNVAKWLNACGFKLVVRSRTTAEEYEIDASYKGKTQPTAAAPAKQSPKPTAPAPVIEDIDNRPLDILSPVEMAMFEEFASRLRKGGYVVTVTAPDTSPHTE